MTMPGRGGQQAAPLNAPPSGAVSTGVQPGTSSAIVNAVYVIVSGTAGGVFVYNGTPASGNPPAYYISNAATDPYGNPLSPAGIVSQSGVDQAALSQGKLDLRSGANTASLAVTPSGQLDLVTSSGVEFDIATNITATAGTITAPTIITTDTWHDVAAASGFTVTTVQRYKLYPDNTVHIQFSLASTNTAGTYTLFTLPTGYIPATQYDGCAPRIFNTTGTFSSGLLNTGFRVLPAGSATPGAVEIVALPGTAINSIAGYYVIPLD